MQQSGLLAWLKRFWPMITVVVVLIVIVIALSKIGYLRVELSGASGTTNATITNQASGQTSKIQSSSPSFSKRVSPGSYEVMAKHDNTSYFAIGQTKGFLQSTEITGKLTPEKSREFVGNNPRTCSYLASGVLYSYYCNDAFSSVLQHVPAKQSQPTYTAKNTGSKVEGSVEGSAQLGGQTYVMIRATETEDTSRPTHTVYLAGANFSLSSPIALKELNNSRQYQLTAFQNGFLLYSGTDDDYWYYQRGFTAPKHLDLPKLSDQSMKRKLVGFNNDTLVIARSNKSDFDNHDTPSIKIGQVKTQVDIYKNGSFRTVSFEQNFENVFTGVQPCGSEYVCIASNNKLYAYEVVDDTLKLLNTVSDVSFIYSSGSQTLLVRSDGILSYNPASSSGYLVYSFDAMKYCGYQPVSETSFIVCVASQGEVPFALLVDTSKDNSDSIDKKVVELQKDSHVKGVSVYGHSIYISPDQGSFIYIQSLGEYGPDPAKRAAAIKDINSTIQRIGIDTKTYKIIY